MVIDAQKYAQARAYFIAHPINPKIVEIPRPSTRLGSPQPNLSVGVSWYGYDLYLTRDDVHSLLFLIWEVGLAAAATLLCAELGPLSALCGAGGAVFGWLIVTIISQQGWSNWNCGRHFQFYYWGGYDNYLWACN